jgi:hypothetical protein
MTLFVPLKSEQLIWQGIQHESMGPRSLLWIAFKRQMWYEQLTFFFWLFLTAVNKMGKSKKGEKCLNNATEVKNFLNFLAAIAALYVTLSVGRMVGLSVCNEFQSSIEHNA